ncbi:hypothetical protein [Peribacillus asahii]|uniref:hypothetical protein n=1 Tax=Peribacillus asahii TaxID=228899 RepID=UPI00207AF0E8|nr:hypothetical protein [Peribacillus asahii]USK62225.1 hypothetical protein LIT37_23920 [Peribacillus asahii]
MFKINGEDLQVVVKEMTSGARKARLGEKFAFIKVEGQYVTFSFNGEDLQVERKVKVEVLSPLDVATTMGELSLKVDVVPKDEEITVQLDGSLLLLKWGRTSKVACEILPQTTPTITIPEVKEVVTGVLPHAHQANNVN